MTNMRPKYDQNATKMRKLWPIWHFLRLWRKKCLGKKMPGNQVPRFPHIMQTCIGPSQNLFSDTSWYLKSQLTTLIALFLDQFKNTFLIAMLREASPHQNGWIFGKVPNGLWPPPLLIFGKLCCRFFKKLYSLKQSNITLLKISSTFCKG